MNFERELGNLFMMGFDGMTVNAEIKELIETHHVGTIILSSKNFECTDARYQLISDLQNLARNSGHPWPLLIATDQENGVINSLYDKSCISQFPPAMGLVAAHDLELAQEVCKATAKQLSAVGVNWILGPVLDVLRLSRGHMLGVRSMGFDTQEVAEYGSFVVQGYHDGGLFTCGKHFPNYGNVESFGLPLDVPTISDTIEELQIHALEPFRRTIRTGLDAVMVGACSLPHVGPRGVLNAFLSEDIVTGLLRQDLGFEGPILSECLEIETIYNQYGIGQAAVMAISAGCDLLTICNTHSNQLEAIGSIKAALDGGLLTRDRILASAARMSNLRRQLSWDNALGPPGIHALRQLRQAHMALSEKAYDRSICILRDSMNVLPLEPASAPRRGLLLLTPLVESLYPEIHQTTAGKASRKRLSGESGYMEGERVFQKLGQELSRYWKGKVQHTSYTATGVRPIHEELISRASIVVVVTAEASTNGYQYGFTKYINSLCKGEISASSPQGKPCLVISVCSPFDFWKDSTISPYLCTFDFTHNAFRSLVSIIFGFLPPIGKLPGLFPRRNPQPNRLQEKPLQCWLVEDFAKDRDMAALRDLWRHVGMSSGSVGQQSLSDASILIVDCFNSVLSKYFVVRNSSTSEVYGFVGTHYIPELGCGSIGALLVEPNRRRLGIGHSLLRRAAAYLEQHPNIRSVQFGSSFPSTHPGVSPSASDTMKPFLESSGWPLRSSQRSTLYTLALPSPSTTTSNLPIENSWLDIVVDSNPNSSMANIIAFFSRLSESSIVQHRYCFSQSLMEEIYASAVTSAHCKVLVLKDRVTNNVLSTAVVYEPDAEVARYLPLRSNQGTVGIAGLIISPSALELSVGIQKILDVAVALRQGKRLGKLEVTAVSTALVT